MTSNLWKKLFIISAALLVTSLILSISSLYRSQRLEGRLTQQEQMLTNYAEIRQQIDVRLGAGQDARAFITPDEPEITTLVDNITGRFNPERFWKDYTEMYRWVLLNIEYTLDSPIPILPENLDAGGENLYWESDFWRLPAETINSKHGDCEDTALLLTSMLLNYTERKFPIWIIGAKTEDPAPKAHIAVAIPLEGAHLAVFDVAGRYYTPFANLGGFGSQPFPQALSAWFTSMERTGMFNSEVYVAFSEDFYREFSGTEEFLSWINEYYLQVNSVAPTTSPSSSSEESR